MSFADVFSVPVCDGPKSRRADLPFAAGNAIFLVRKLKPDVIIMDLMMPVLSGVEATKRILDGDPTAKIVILTSFGGSVDLQQALAAGALGRNLLKI